MFVAVVTQFAPPSNETWWVNTVQLKITNVAGAPPAPPTPITRVFCWLTAAVSCLLPQLAAFQRPVRMIWLTLSKPCSVASMNTPMASVLGCDSVTRGPLAVTSTLPA